MEAHPFTCSAAAKIAGIAILALATALLWVLLSMYSSADGWMALSIAVVYTMLLAATGYAYWFVNPFLKTVPGMAAAALIVQTICLGLLTVAVYLLGREDIRLWARDIPLIAIYGLALWTIMVLWYGANGESELYGREAEPPAGGAAERLDRISVKEGSRLYIIKTGELLYVQAYGDYVLLHTSEGKHIKEETMKYYEACLPANFVRIHRSFIVNSEQIVRMEPAGKESYSVWLHNGTCLKASATGYKLLKHRLNL